MIREPFDDSFQMLIFGIIQGTTKKDLLEPDPGGG